MRKDITEEELEAKALRQGVESRIRRLRVLVDQIESQVENAIKDAEQGRGRYSRAAEIFVKELPLGMVNLGLEQLVHYAGTADIYHAEAEKQKEMEEKA